MFCGWEGNRRSGVVLAMRHRLSGLSTYGLKGQYAGDEHPTYTPAGVWSPLPFLNVSTIVTQTFNNAVVQLFGQNFNKHTYLLTC